MSVSRVLRLIPGAGRRQPDGPTARAGVAPSLRAGIVWTGIGNAAYLALQYALLMVLSKLGAVEDVGRYALAQGIAMPLIVVSQMQLRQVQVTDVRGDVRFTDYLWTRIAATLLAMAGIAVVGAWTDGSGPLLMVLLMVGAAKAFESISDVLHAKLQQQEHMDRIALSLVIRGVASIAVFSALLWAGYGVVPALAGVAVVCAAVLALVDVPLLRFSAGSNVFAARWRPSASLRLARLALPLTLSSGLLALSGNVPRYYLEWLRGPQEVALYAVALMPISMVGLFSGAITQATTARAARYFQLGEMRLFQRLTIGVTAVGVVAGVATLVLFALAGPELLTLLFTPEYRAASDMTVILAAAVAIGGLSSYGSMVIVAARRFTFQLWNVLLAIVVQLPLCYSLVNRDGATGAAWAELLRYCVGTSFLLASGWWIARRHTQNFAFRSVGAEASRPLPAEASDALGQRPHSHA